MFGALFIKIYMKLMAMWQCLAENLKGMGHVKHHLPSFFIPLKVLAWVMTAC